MNPFAHQAIENSLDNRLVDLFVNQNPSNRWVSLDDLARWVYERNDVKPHHRRYVTQKVMRIIGSLYTKEAQESFLESGYVTVDGNREFAYRLKPGFKVISYARTPVQVP